jgi:hypothetical protein
MTRAGHHRPLIELSPGVYEKLDDAAKALGRFLGYVSSAERLQGSGGGCEDCDGLYVLIAPHIHALEDVNKLIQDARDEAVRQGKRGSKGGAL